jgi:NADH-quinone oxidoreductase subunit F
MAVTNRPPITTVRFGYDDAHTLTRYLATGGYEGLRRALAQPPEDVAALVKEANLQGRGGAGFPAGTKWGFLNANSYPRWLVVNGDESEPGTYKDRLLCERDPHQLI